MRAIIPEGVPRHQNPIPAAAVHRGVLASSAIAGRDPTTGTYPHDKDRQIALAFDYLRNVLAAAEASIRDVVKCDLYFADKADRTLVNAHWLTMFPDETARPARHSHVASLPAGCCLQIVVLAILERS